MQSLLLKAKTKAASFPDALDFVAFDKIKTLIDFDNYFTGPVHGFKDAEDYYARCNSLQFLDQLKHPTLILSAQDDPFLPESCYPYDLANQNELLHLLTPRYGGHVGFYTKGKSHYWNELQLLDFANKFSLSP